MTDTINKQDLLNWLNQYADALLARGPMYGEFSDQEAIMHTLISMRNYVNGTIPKGPGDNARWIICRKHKLNTVFSFAHQLKGDASQYSKEQEHFSQILREWWEHE